MERKTYTPPRANVVFWAPRNPILSGSDLDNESYRYSDRNLTDEDFD